jgi:hypothetical protein
MAGPVGILAGMQETGGPPFAAAERAVEETRKAGQEQQRTDIAQQGAKQSAERFELEKQFQPFRLKEAEQTVRENDRRFEEATLQADRKAEAMRRAENITKNIGTMSLQDFALEGMNISMLMGDPVGFHRGFATYKEIENQTEQGKAGAQLYSTLQQSGVLGKVLSGQGSVEDNMTVINEAVKNPRAFNVFGKPMMKHAEENLKKIMPQAAVDAVKEFYGKAGSMTMSDPDAEWASILNNHPDAQPYFLKNPKEEPPAVTMGRKAKEKVAERVPVEQAKAAGAVQKEQAKTEGIAANIKAKGEATQGVERVKGEEKRKTDAAKPPTTKSGGSSAVKGIDPQRMNAARTELDQIVKDPKRQQQRTKANFERWISANLEPGPNGEAPTLSKEEATRLRAEYGQRFP